jgi:hypothetical protein
MSIFSFVGSMRCRAVQLGRVGQRVQYQIDDVPIRQCIKNVIALASPDNQPLAAEQFQALRNSGELLAQCGNDFGNAQLLFLEQVKDAQASRIPHSPEYFRCARQGLRWNRAVYPPVVADFAAWDRFFDRAPPFRYSTIP